MGIKSEDAGMYDVGADDEIIRKALAILDSRVRDTDPLTSPDMTKKFLRLHFAEYDSEVFCAMFLDQRHRPIAIEDMFFGTIDGASVYPREVVKRALKHNAAAVIFAHNHPSGVAEPSQADEQITKRLKDALALVDIRVLDHMVVGSDVISFAERGLI